MRRIAILALLIYPFIAMGTGYSEGLFTNYSIMDDLYDITKDGDFIWCVSEHGIIRWNYKDSTCVKYTAAEGLSGEKALYLKTDKNGGIWFAANRMNYSGGTDGLGAYHLNEHAITNNRIGAINMAYVDNTNTKWFALFSRPWGGNHPRVFLGLRTFDGENWKVFNSETHGLPSEEVWSMAQDNNGNYWFASGAGVARFDGTTWTVFREGDSGLESMYPKEIISDRNGIVYTISGNHIQYYSEGKWINTPAYASSYSPITAVANSTSNIWVLYNQPDPFIVHFWDEQHAVYWMKDIIPGRQVEIRKIISGEGDDLWVASNNGLLHFFQGNWVVYTDPLGIHSIQNMLLDAGNRMWIRCNNYDYQGYIHEKINYIDESGFHDFDIDKAGLPADAVPRLVDNGGKIIFTSANGLFRYDGEKTTNIGYDPQFVITNWKDIEILKIGPNGTIWFVRYGNLHWLNDNKISRDWQQKGIIDIAIDSNNGVWMGTETDGLLYFSGSEWRNYPITPETRVVNVLADQDDTIWAASVEGLWRLNGDQVDLVAKDLEPVSNSFPTSLVADKNGIIWVGTSNGVLRYDGKTLNRITTTDGLADNRVYQIVIGKKDEKWYRTGSGITLFRENITPTSIEFSGGGSNKPRMVLNSRPNPFNASTTIDFSLPVGSRTTLFVYSVTGQRVRTLVSGVSSAGSHSFAWDGRNDSGHTVSSGLYFARLESGGHAAVVKMLFLK